MKNYFGIRAFIFFSTVQYRSFELIHNPHPCFFRNRRIHIVFVICYEENIIILSQKSFTVVQNIRDTLNITVSRLSALSFVKRSDFRIIIPLALQTEEPKVTVTKSGFASKIYEGQAIGNDWQIMLSK